MGSILATICQGRLKGKNPQNSMMLQDYAFLELHNTKTDLARFENRQFCCPF